jgi:threonine/homoserine/homoserine lactone efflux protein
VYRQDLLTNVLDPKVAFFFLAFMPQFILAKSPCLAWFSSMIGDRVHRSTRFSNVLNRSAGALFVFLGKAT